MKQYETLFKLYKEQAISTVFAHFPAVVGDYDAKFKGVIYVLDLALYLAGNLSEDQKRSDAMGHRGSPELRSCILRYSFNHAAEGAYAAKHDVRQS